MTMRKQIHDDMTQALRERGSCEEATERLATLRVLFAEIKNKEIEVGHELSDDEVVGVVAKEHKRRKEAAHECGGGGRKDLADRELAQAAMLEAYLPEQLSDEELAALVGEAIEATGAESPKEMGKVMGWLAPKIKGRADGKQASQMVSARLAGS